MDSNVIIALIQAGATVLVAVFTWFTNHKIQSLKKIKEEMRIELKDQHKETLEKIAELERRTDEIDIAVVRNRIVAFDNICRLDIENNGIKMYQYKTFFKDEDIWKEYHIKYPTLNGEIDEAIKNIHKHFESAKF